MKIGLIDMDSKIPNLAIMKISAYHKKQGDSVEFYSPLVKYDRVYGSKVFTNSKYGYTPKDAIIGGSGFSLETKLDPIIEHCYPDYSLYNIDYAMGYLTRGCINNCPFCIVRKKEGMLHKHADLVEFWNGQKNLMLLDNCLTDYKDAKTELEQIRDLGIRLNLCQGFNVRTIKPEIASILSDIKLWDPPRQWHIAWDNVNDEKKVFEGIKTLNDCGIKNYKIMCYVLIGYNSTPEQDMYRINKLREIDVDPFVMPYKKDRYCTDFARWLNKKQLYNSCTFEDYRKREGTRFPWV